MAKKPTSSLVERLRELASRDPDWVAVSTEGRSISRGELDAVSDARARELIHLGVRPGDYVCIALPSGVEFVSVLIAGWKTGGVPLPLSVQLADAEIADLIELVDPRVIVGAEVERVGNRRHLPAGHRPAPHPEGALDMAAVSPTWKAIGSAEAQDAPR
jgi:bile acid-coenzyme A ligase